MAKEDLVDALSALKKLSGQEVWVTLAAGEILLARTDLTLEDVLLEDGRLVVTGSFRELEDKILYREVALPLERPDGIEVAAFAGELRLTTPEGLFLEVVPIGPVPPREAP